MAQLIYSSILSVDGYIEDESGAFDWSAPDEEVHAFVNELERSIGTHLYGRRMYETMVYWETASLDDEPRVYQDYARIWKAADKVVFSRTLSSVNSARTRIEREFEPDAVAALKANATSDLSIGGANLAARAIAADLVDEYHLFVVPVIVGGGKRALPDGERVSLALRDERRFGNGTIYLRYARS
jgi:dihydrofolate reductase